jgi:hypothetical protein
MCYYSPAIKSSRYDACSRKVANKARPELTQRQETLNFWKQTSHVLKYFRAEEDPKARLPSNFINGFLEVISCPTFCD